MPGSRVGSGQKGCLAELSAGYLVALGLSSQLVGNWAKCEIPGELPRMLAIVLGVVVVGWIWARLFDSKPVLGRSISGARVRLPSTAGETTRRWR